MNDHAYYAQDSFENRSDALSNDDNNNNVKDEN